MATAHDVAKAILDRTGEISAMKLQKLAYYCQAWSLVWDEEPMFDNRIEAWANGPVVVDLYAQHKGKFLVSAWPMGDASCLTKDQVETIDAVIKHYGGFNAQQLSNLTHSESPWLDARRGMSQAERGNVEITPAAMHEYYVGL